jgi:hypothetical protein
MMFRFDNIAQVANVRVVDKLENGCFSSGSDLCRILRMLGVCSSLGLVFGRTKDNFDRNLYVTLE